MSAAAALFQRATQLGSYRTPYHLLGAHAEGLHGVPRNASEALRQYRAFLAFAPHWREGGAAAASDAAARDSWAAGLRLASLAEQGCPRAAANLGFLLHRGELGGGTGKGRHAAALLLWRRAAAAGDGEAALLAGQLLARGHEHGLDGGGGAGGLACMAGCPTPPGSLGRRWLPLLWPCWPACTRAAAQARLPALLPAFSQAPT